jgi:uncharacterized protein YkwD
MARKHPFRPAEPAAVSRLESRLALSLPGLMHHVMPLIHVVVHHHVVSHHPANGHGTVLLTGALANPGPTLQSILRLPIVIVPIGNPPVSTTGSTPLTSAPPAPAPAPQTPPALPTSAGILTGSGAMSAQEQTIVDLVNQVRVQNGLALLQVDSRLVEMAQIQSTDMAELGQFDHDLPGAALPTLQSRAQYVGYNYSFLGENLAFNYTDANTVMAAWLASPGHRENILNADYTQIGVGIAYDSQGEPYYTQDFGMPA